MSILSKKAKRNSIIISLIIIILFFWCSFFFIQTINQVITNEIFLYLDEIAQQSATVVNSRVQAGAEILKAIAVAVEANDDFSTKGVLKLIAAESEVNNYKRMGLINNDGMAITTDGKTLDLSERDYFYEAMKGQTVISNTVIDVSDGMPINVYASPLCDANKEIQGVIFATIDNFDITKMLNTTSFGGKGSSIIINSEGTSIIDTRENANIKFDSLSKLFESANIVPLENGCRTIQCIFDALKDGKGGQFAYELNEEEVFVSFAPLEENNWFLLCVVPAYVATARADFINTISIMFVIVIALALTLLFYYIAVSQNKARKQLERLAYVDEITNNDNYYKFEIKSKNLLIKNKDANYAMLSFDIEKFKVFNHIYGNEKGNDVLKYISNTLESYINQYETAARITADCFAVLAQYECNEAMEKKIEKFCEIIYDGFQNYKLKLSFGICLIGKNEISVSTRNLLDKANMAKKTVKGNTSKYFEYFSESALKNISNEKEMEDEMYTALANNEFEMYLQPKYSLHTSRFCGAEALVRWIHHSKGLILPNDFIPLFERNDFIIKLDMFMIEQAAKTIKVWIDKGYTPLPISVNISRNNLLSDKFVGNLVKLVDEYNIPHKYLEFEFTESGLYENLKELMCVGESLKKAGFTIAIDDFGSGYSSVNMLKNMIVDVIKFDRGFFVHSSYIDREKIVIEGMIEVVNKLGITVVAEGIETEEKVDMLRNANCDIIQGYYYAKPMPKKDFEKFVFHQIK